MSKSVSAPKPIVAAYYFPNYHPGDARNTRLHGPGWTEWELVKRAEPRFPGHRQPLLPTWGMEDESDPAVMATKIDAAADHGVDAFLFDWYWYDDGPFLDRGLDRGFLGAPNNDRLKFALMWANHDWLDVHPHKRGAAPPLLYPGRVTLKTFDAVCDLVIERYFSHPSYLRLHGRPYFSVYELSDLMKVFGSVAATRRGLESFRARAEKAGLPGVHLNAVLWGNPIAPDEATPRDRYALMSELGFDSVTSYVWIHHASLAKPFLAYDDVRDQYFAFWSEAASRLRLPYFPNVTMGWDSTARTVQSDVWDPGGGYTFSPVIVDNSPEKFREALQQTRDRMARMNHPALLTVNAWNEWTEGSYLEPDTVSGMKYLEAIRDVFA